MNADPKHIEAIILACLEGNPVDFRSVDDQEVKRVQAAIKRATAAGSGAFRDPVTRRHFLCGCLDFTEHLPEEHLIVGYGYRYGSTTEIERVSHVVGERRRVAVPDSVRADMRRHHHHRSDAEVIVFHNHPRTGDEPEWFYTLKALVQDLPIASMGDREQLQQHAFNTVGVVRELLGQGRVLFYLGESGFVKAIRLPPLLPYLEQLGGLNSPERVRP